MQGWLRGGIPIIYDLWITFLILRAVARSGFAFKTLARQRVGFSLVESRMRLQRMREPN